MRFLIQLLLWPFPWFLRRPLLCLLPGFRIARTARIGFSVLNVRNLVMGERALIGHLTYAKGASSLVIEDDGILGHLNWVTAYPEDKVEFFGHCQGRKAILIIRQHGAITSRHMIDCTGSIEIGAFAIVGGWGSQIVTHSIDYAVPRQDAAAISVGAYSFVGSRSILLMGSKLPDRSILAAGSVYGLKGEHPSGLYSGLPAKFVRELDAETGFFHRERGFVT
jgi:acetyltransferase-like isoleucine patch superfamily enzyme